jgi:hypothetical protein
VSTPDDEDSLARAKRLGRRYMLLAYLAFAAAFIVLSTWEVIAGVFGLDAPGEIAAHGKPDAACVEAIRRYAAAIEGLDPGAADLGDAAESVVDRACAGGSSRANLDALAAAHRFRRALTSARSARAAARSGPDGVPASRQPPARERRDLDAYLVN